MRKINVLFTLYSLTAFIIIIERLSPTTRIFLQPYDFIRLHEINQTFIFLSISVIISFFILQLVTDNFQTLKERGNALWFLAFIVGTYLFGAGEGWHEVASATFNTYCNVHHIANLLCGGLFVNDYYVGNPVFYIGGVLMNTSLLALSLKKPTKVFDNKDLIILIANSVVFGFSWFAVAAADKTFVGLFFATILLVISAGFFFKIKNKARSYPYILYSMIAYFLATFGAVAINLIIK